MSFSVQNVSDGDIQLEISRRGPRGMTSVSLLIPRSQAMDLTPYGSPSELRASPNLQHYWRRGMLVIRETVP